MKTTEYNQGKTIRRILIGMATDRTVCARVASQWIPEGLFATRWENMVGAWCIRHLAKHGTPVDRHIESIFEQWAEKTDDEKTIKLLETFLRALDEDLKQEAPLASDYVLDLAGRHFNSVRMQQTMEAVEFDLEVGKVDEANERFNQHRKVELGVGAVVTPAKDFEAWVDTFDSEKVQPLIEFPEPLARFIGPEFSRDSFISFTGAYARKKSWLLLEMAYRAVRQKRRVMLFEVGDMSERQVMTRLGQRAARRPRKDSTVNYPIRFDDIKEGPIIQRRELKAVDARSAFQAWRKVDQMGRFRLSCHSSSSITATGIAGMIQEGERGGWVPDVIVIDYVDLLAPPEGTNEKRDQIDETWKTLRRISQDMHCLVITASQGDAASYKQDLIRGGNFSDARTKNDHITAGFGINVNDKDKERGVIRLNWLKRRDDEFSESWQIAVAGCLAIGCPMILGCR